MDEEDQEFQDFVEKELAPKVQSSAFCISLCPSDPSEIDAKFSIELGIMIMMDKPIICCVKPGTKIPKKLAMVTDRFVEMDPDNKEESMQRLANVINEVRKELESKHEK